MRITDMFNVTAAEFQSNVEHYLDEALRKPVAITRNGRASTVLVSAEEYGRLKRRDRRVMTAGDWTEAELAALESAKVPEGYAYLDAELASWKPPES